MVKDLEAVRAIAATVDANTEPVAERQAAFAQLQSRYAKDASPVLVRMSEVMARWEPGLFVGEAALEAQVQAGASVPELPEDNLALERWFKLPKHHARHVHGRAHAGLGLVHHGPTLMLVLDAHHYRDGPLTREELQPYRAAMPPESQRAACARALVMRRARSAKNRPKLLAELEARYAAAR